MVWPSSRLRTYHIPPSGAQASPAIRARRNFGQASARRSRRASSVPATASITPRASAPPVGLVHSAPASSSPLTRAGRARFVRHASMK